MLAERIGEPKERSETRFYLASKAGGCRSGGDSHGTVWHLVRGWSVFSGGGKALCGAQPSIQWSHPWLSTQKVTCKKCEKAVERWLESAHW